MRAWQATAASPTMRRREALQVRSRLPLVYSIRIILLHNYVARYEIVLVLVHKNLFISLHSNWGIGNTDKNGIKARLAKLESIQHDQLSHGQQYPKRQQATPLELTSTPLQQTTPLTPTQPTNSHLHKIKTLCARQLPTSACKVVLCTQGLLRYITVYTET